MSRNFETIVKSINSVRNTIYSPGDVIEIDVPATDVAVINPRGTKLKFNLEMTDSNCCSQPDGTAGCWSVIKTLQIFDLNTNTLLEQIDECNHLVSMMKHYSKTPSIVNNWELQHGQCSNSTPSSLYYTQQGAVGQVQNNKVECVVDLQVSGLLKQSAPLLPNILIGGIRIRITLEDVPRSITTYPCARAVNLPETLPYDVNTKYPDEWAQCAGGGITTAVAAPSPLPPANSFYDIKTATLAGAITQVILDNTAPVAGAIPFDRTNNCQIKVGQQLVFWDGVTQGTHITSGAVTAVTDLGGALGLQVDFVNVNVFPVFAPNDACWIAISSLTTNYQVSNLELLVSSAEMGTEDLRSMVNKSSTTGGMNVDYKSWNLYRDNLQALVSNPQVTLDCTERRALSLVQLPYNPNATLGQERPPMRTINDEGINYSYTIANRNTPSRPVPIDRVSSNVALAFDAIQGLEVEKAVERCDVVPRFMCDNNNYFMIARALSRREHSFNANSNNIRLSILYSTAATANLTNKVLESFMYHIRRLNISNGAVRVTY
jgi:hypothetical protein